MLARLLTLALLAAPGNRCDAIWSSIEAGKDFKQDVAGNLLHNDASKIAKLRGHFLEGCAKLSEDDQACASAHPGRTLLRSCAALGQVFHEAATSSDVGGGGLTELRQQGLAREALAKLRELGQAARMLRLREGPTETFAFPPSIEESPKQSCCETAAKTCIPTADDFSAPTWTALGFGPKEPLRFHYSFTSSGKGREASFVARAIGDPDCNGKTEIWEIHGQSSNGKFVVGDVEEK